MIHNFISSSSFLIVTQPHSGVNPITIYERRRPGEYTAKISVTIISLLNDFIEQHPNLIELVDIGKRKQLIVYGFLKKYIYIYLEPSLHPISPHYKLAEPQTISWKPCQIQTELAGRSRTFLCAELTSITIEQSSKTDTRVRFAQLLHSLKFAIKIHVNHRHLIVFFLDLILKISSFIQPKSKAQFSNTLWIHCNSVLAHIIIKYLSY